LKKKILVVGSSLQDMGGIVTVIANIEKSIIADMYSLKRVETYISGNLIKRLSIFLSGFINFLFQITFNRPEVVHIHMSNNGSFYRKSIIVLWTRLFRVPSIIHVHASSFEEFYYHNKLQKKYIAYILNTTDKLIVLSNEWKIFFSTILSEKKIEVLNNGVFKIDSEKKVLHNRVPECLFLGRLGERKGTYDLLKSIKELKNRNVQAKFLLAGDGEISKVKRIIDEYNIEDYVEILGWIGKEEKERLFKKVDILVLPSYNEGLPMAILEAMNYSLPIISTKVGGIPEVIKNKENGFIIDPGNIDALTSSLQALITDKDLRYQVGCRNKEVINLRFEMNSLMKILSSIYEELAA